jgi:hypothetical protein
MIPDCKSEGSAGWNLRFNGTFNLLMETELTSWVVLPY